MAYVIFGGNRFVGQYLARELKKRDRVIVCDIASASARLPAGIAYFRVDIRKLIVTK